MGIPTRELSFKIWLPVAAQKGSGVSDKEKKRVSTRKKLGKKGTRKAWRGRPGGPDYIESYISHDRPGQTRTKGDGK